MKQRIFLLAGALAALALAACNGGNTIATPTPGPTCSPAETVQMIYPIPGATGVPDNPQQLVFAVASPLPSNWNAVINNANTLNGNQLGTAGLETITAAQVPSPAATPSMANPVYQSVTLATGLKAAETVWVWVNNTATTCTPLGPVGNFTTQ